MLKELQFFESLHQEVSEALINSSICVDQHQSIDQRDT